MSIAAVILAAGFSRRLGRPKQSLVLAGESLLHRSVRTAMDAGLSPVIAVVADPSFIDELQAMGTVVILNRDADQGIASSIQCGVRWCQETQATGVVLLTCDQVALTPKHLRALVSDPARITASHYAGRNGVPAYFSSSSFENLMGLTGDTGARDLLRTAATIAAEELSLDIDTDADVKAAEEYLRKQAVS